MNMRSLWLGVLCWLVCVPWAGAAPEIRLPFPPYYGFDVVLEADGLAVDKDGIWKLEHTRMLQALPFPDYVSRVTWSAPWLVGRHDDTTFFQSSLEQFIRPISLDFGPDAQASDEIQYRHQGKWLAVFSPSTSPARFQVYNLERGRVETVFELTEAEVCHWAFDGEYLALAHQDTFQPMLSIWHWPSQRQVKVLNGPQSPVQALQMQGNLLVSVDQHQVCSWRWSEQSSPQACLPLKSGEAYHRRWPVALGRFAIALATHITPVSIDYQLRYFVTWQPNGELKRQKPATSVVHTLEKNPPPDDTKNGGQMGQTFYQPQTQRTLAIFNHTEIRWWEPGQPEFQVLKPCQVLGASFASDCWFWVAYWHENQVFLQLKNTRNDTQSLAVLNLETGAIRLLQNLKSPAENIWEPMFSGCLTPQHWVLPAARLVEPSKLTILDHRYGSLQTQHFKAPVESVVCQENQIWVRLQHPGRDYQNMFEWQKLFSSELGVVTPPEQAEFALPSDPWRALRTGTYDYISFMPGVPPKPALPGYIHLDKGLRRVALYFTQSGPVWLTDQGHYFRQGKTPELEMPYLVDGLTSRVLPARLENWPEVQRALLGLPALKNTGYRVHFYQED